MSNPNFLPTLVKKCGYPVWGKIIANYEKSTTGRSTNEEINDTIIKLPFVQPSTTTVNAFVEALINDSMLVQLYESYKYKQLPNGAINATALTAEKYINQFFMLQNRVFEHSLFQIKDTSLFRNLLPLNTNSTAKVNYVKIEPEATNGTIINSFPSNGCFTYRTHYTTYETVNGVYGIVYHTVRHSICYPVVQSIILSEIADPNTNLSNGLGSFSGGLNYVGTNPTGFTGNPSNSSGVNTNNTNVSVGFLDVEEENLLLEQIEQIFPNLLDDEQGFLLAHKQQMKEIVNYLTANNTQEAKDKVLLHIAKMKTDTDYMALAISHSLGSTNETVWWDDYFWYTNPSNEDILNPSDKPFWLLEFPIDVPEPPVIDNGITIGEVDLTLPTNVWPDIGSTPNRNNTEDLAFGTNGDVTGIDNNLLNRPDNILVANMSSMFNLFTNLDGGLKQVGHDFINIFKNNTTATTIVSNNTLDPKVKESTVFQNFVKRFGNQFAQTLKAKNGILSPIVVSNPPEYDFPIKIPQEHRPRFNSLYHKFHGLQILINDTEQTKVDLDSYTIDNLGFFKANITVTITDHFGLDKNDALVYQLYSKGFPSWWLLQHQRNHAPFITRITIKTQISGNYHLATL